MRFWRFWQTSWTKVIKTRLKIAQITPIDEPSLPPTREKIAQNRKRSISNVRWSLKASSKQSWKGENQKCINVTLDLKMFHLCCWHLLFDSYFNKTYFWLTQVTRARKNCKYCKQYLSDGFLCVKWVCEGFTPGTELNISEWRYGYIWLMSAVTLQIALPILDPECSDKLKIEAQYIS